MRSNVVLLGLSFSLTFALLMFSLDSYCQKLPHKIEHIHAIGVTKVKTKGRICRYKINKYSYGTKEYYNNMLIKEIYFNNILKLKPRAILTYKYNEISDTLWSLYKKSSLDSNVFYMQIHFRKGKCTGINNGNHKTLKVSNINNKAFIESGNISVKSTYKTIENTIIRDVFYDDKHIEQQLYVYDQKGYLISETVIITDTTAVIADVVPWSKTKQYAYTIEYDKIDKHGNWTRSYYVQENGKRIFRSKRKITYYE